MNKQFLSALSIAVLALCCSVNAQERENSEVVRACNKFFNNGSSCSSCVNPNVCNTCTPSSCSPCNQCNACTPQCIVAGCFSVSDTGAVTGQCGTAYQVVRDATDPLVTDRYIITFLNQFCSPVNVLFRSSAAPDAIPTTPAVVDISGEGFTIVSVPPSSTVCFFAIPGCN